MSSSPPSKRSKAPVPCLEATAVRQQLASLPVPKELLEEILVRIASPIDLLRASTTCVSFHRVITDPIFLRRYRCLHPPLILGSIKCDDGGGSSSEVFQPTPAPNPSAPAGRATASAADFSLDYVHDGGGLGECYKSDARDGRILVQGPTGEQLRDLFVCDPLYRQYLLLPPIPDDEVHGQDVEFHDAFFVPRADEDDDEASFRVAMQIQSTTRFSAFIYSSGSGTWSAAASNSWDTLGFGDEPVSFSGWASYAYGCIYWQVKYSNKLVKLDMNRMEFSIVDLPLGLLGRHDEDQGSILIFEEPDSNGRLGMIFIHDNMDDGTSSLRYYTSVQNDDANEWQMKEEIPLPVDDFTPHSCSCQYRRFVFLEGRLLDDQGMLLSTCFALDIKTMEIERVSQMRSPEDSVYDFLPYVGFPPSMSPRRI